MADFTIDAQERTVVGKKVKTVRNQGLVPITVYGPKTPPMNMQVPYRALELALMKAGGTNLIDVKASGKTHVVLARDVQRDKIKGTILHVDFMAVDMKAQIRTDVPIVLINTSEPVESRVGILLTGTNTITIETLPDKLIHQIEVDLAQLKQIGDTITVADLDLGEGITIINELEELIAGVRQTSAARAESDLEEQAASGSSEPEVIHKGKDEEDD